MVISDTVGFIRKLPHQLVEAFKATLEELEYADLLLHVIDASNPEWQEQARIVDDLIRELGAENIPCIRVYNKSDLAFAFQRDKEGDAVSVSAKTGEGLDRLLSAIDKKLDKGTKRVTLHLPYDKAGALDSLYREAKVESVEYGETVDVVAVCTPRIIGQLKDYIEALDGARRRSGNERFPRTLWPVRDGVHRKTIPFYRPSAAGGDGGAGAGIYRADEEKIL